MFYIVCHVLLIARSRQYPLLDEALGGTPPELRNLLLHRADYVRAFESTFASTYTNVYLNVYYIKQ